MNTSDSYEWYCNEGNIKEFIDIATYFKNYISAINKGSDPYTVYSLKNELNKMAGDIPELSTAISDLDRASKTLEKAEESCADSLLLADEIIAQTNNLEKDTNGNISLARDEYNNIIKSFNEKYGVTTENGLGKNDINVGLGFAVSLALDPAINALKNGSIPSYDNFKNNNQNMDLPKTGIAFMTTTAINNAVDAIQKQKDNKSTESKEHNNKKQSVKSNKEQEHNNIGTTATITKSGTKSTSKKTNSIKTGSVVASTGVVSSKAVKKAAEKVFKKYNPKPSTVEKDIYISKPNSTDNKYDTSKPNTNINKPNIPNIIKPDNNTNINKPTTPPENNINNPANNQVNETPPVVKPNDTQHITNPNPPVNNNPNNSNSNGPVNMGSNNSNNPTVDIVKPTTNNNTINNSASSAGGSVVYKKGYTPPIDNKPNNNIVGTTTDSATGIVTENVDIPDTKTDLFETDPDIKDYIDIGADRTTSSSTGSGIGILPIAGGLAATAAIGAGVKIYKDRKENNDFNDSEDSLSNENKFWTEEEANVRHSEKEIYNDENNSTDNSYRASNNEVLNNDTWSMEEDIIDSANTQIDLLEN